MNNTKRSFIDSVARIPRIVRDRGGLLASLKRTLASPRKVFEFAAELWRDDWTKLVFTGDQGFGFFQEELKRSSLVANLQGRLREEFTYLQGEQIRGRRMVSGSMRTLHSEVLWAIVRESRPKLVVETGVCNGLSSAVILEALTRNGEGRLVSVDVPEFSDPTLNTREVWHGKGGAVIPAGKSVGWLVRDEVHARWSLQIGRSSEVLPAILEENSPIDLFVHDSEHSYENQIFEFRNAIKALRPGGILVATDVTWSSAFKDFWQEIKGSGARKAYVDPSCAIVVKPV
jgi:predicted O-methyltransferase YrrM